MRDNGNPAPDVIGLAVLAHLAVEPQHGYGLMGTLDGYGGLTSGGLYRKLVRLGEEGFIVSTWDTPDKGPARRVWAITYVGLDHLAAEGPALEHYGRFVRSTLRLLKASTSPTIYGGGR